MGSIQTASACEPSDSGYAVISSNSLLSFPKGHKCVLALNAIRRPNDFNVQQERGGFNCYAIARRPIGKQGYFRTSVSGPPRSVMQSLCKLFPKFDTAACRRQVPK